MKKLLVLSVFLTFSSIAFGAPATTPGAAADCAGDRVGGKAINPPATTSQGGQTAITIEAPPVQGD